MNPVLRSPELLIILALVNFPIWLLLVRLMFDSWADLGEALVFWLAGFWLQMVDVVFRGGDWAEHQWESLKLLVPLVLLVAAVFSEYAFLIAHYPGSMTWAHRIVPL